MFHHPTISYHIQAMSNHRISDDIKETALRLKAQGKDKIHKIIALIGFSESTLYQAQCCKCTTGSVAKAQVLG